MSEDDDEMERKETISKCEMHPNAKTDRSMKDLLTTYREESLLRLVSVTAGKNPHNEQNKDNKENRKLESVPGKKKIE